MTEDCTITTDRQCSPCVAPTFSDDGLTCKQCNGEEGKYNDEDGAAFCKTAKAGYKPTSDRKVRMSKKQTGQLIQQTTNTTHNMLRSSQGEEQCAAGTYSTGGANECSECGEGETSGAGAAGCSTCAT